MAEGPPRAHHAGEPSPAYPAPVGATRDDLTALIALYEDDNGYLSDGPVA